MTLKSSLLGAALVASALASGFAYAQPSQYFMFKNKVTGATMCETQALDANWIQQSGPYEDPNCKIKS